MGIGHLVVRSKVAAGAKETSIDPSCDHASYHREQNCGDGVPGRRDSGAYPINQFSKDTATSVSADVEHFDQRLHFIAGICSVAINRLSTVAGNNLS